MKCKFLLLLNVYIAIFTWQNCNSYGQADIVFLGLDRQLSSFGSNRGAHTLPHVFFEILRPSF
jgi:hypothetical protein